MPKAISDGYLDGGIDAIAQSTAIHVCSAEPANAAGVAAVSLATVAVTPADYTKVNGTVSGRRLNAAQQADVPITSNGDATHIVHTNGVDIAVTTCTLRTLVAGETLTIPQHGFEFRDPT